MKTPSVGVELFRADRLTEMKMLVVAFRSFSKAPTDTFVEK